MLRCALPVGVLAAMAAVAPPSAVDVVPVLTSTPFAAAPGRPVSHAVSLSGTGTGTGVVAGVRVTFTTTVALDGVTATASQGSCPVVTPRRVVCDLGDVAFPGNGTAPTVTVTGTVHPGTAPGTLVQNLVTVAASAPDADPTDDQASNAYLVAAASATASASPTRPAAPAKPKPAGRTPVVVAALGLAGLATGLLIWRRRRRS